MVEVCKSFLVKIKLKEKNEVCKYFLVKYFGFETLEASQRISPYNCIVCVRETKDTQGIVTYSKSFEHPKKKN